eukprot:1194798-Prorocentrum_minimum.AAC.4
MPRAGANRGRVLLVTDMVLMSLGCRHRAYPYWPLIYRVFNGEIDADTNDAANMLVGTSVVLGVGTESAKSQSPATLPTSAKVLDYPHLVRLRKFCVTPLCNTLVYQRALCECTQLRVYVVLLRNS